MLSPYSTAQMNTFVLVNTLVIHNEYILDNTLLILLPSADQQPLCRHPLPRQGIVDPLHTIFKTFHAIRGGHADLNKQLKHLDFVAPKQLQVAQVLTQPWLQLELAFEPLLRLAPS